MNQIDFNPEKIKYILDQFKENTLASNPTKAHKIEDQELMDWTLYSSEEDALAAYLLASPYLKETNVLHDVGCWNGQNMINLLYYSHLRNKTLWGAIGTDINITVLMLQKSLHEC